MRLSKGHRDDRTNFNTLPHPHPYHHHQHHHLFHHQLTRKWKAQTRGPLDTPALIIRLKGVPYAPTSGSTLGFLVLAKSTLSLGGTNEEKHQQPCWQLIHAFKQLIINTSIHLCPNISSTSQLWNIINGQLKHSTKHG